jgi:hypothetical protein
MKPSVLFYACLFKPARHRTASVSTRIVVCTSPGPASKIKKVLNQWYFILICGKTTGNEYCYKSISQITGYKTIAVFWFAEILYG